MICTSFILIYVVYEASPGGLDSLGFCHERSLDQRALPHLRVRPVSLSVVKGWVREGLQVTEELAFSSD